MESRTTKKMGELMVSKGLLQAWQVELALSEQRGTKEFFGAIAVRKGWVTEETLLQLLAEQFGMPVVRLDLTAMDWTLSQRVPPSVQAEQACIPITADAHAVTVAIANPLDVWAVSELEKAWPFRKIQLVLAPRRDIQMAIQYARQKAVQSLDRGAR